jgi:predicted alpha/beta-hydrolase family hydrolase
VSLAVQAAVARPFMVIELKTDPWHARACQQMTPPVEDGMQEFSLAVPGAGEVSAVLLRPARAHALLVLAHGAGAGMRHSFLEALSRELAAAGVATLRYQFPYMEHKRRGPDRPKILTETVRAAIRAAIEREPDLPLLAGGKSMGGRMTSLAASEQPLDKVRGLVFVGFPLHAPKKPGIQRAEHLQGVHLPMLFLQGTRDPLADLDLLRPICTSLGPSATLHVIDTADHSFHVLKRSGQTDAQILQELAQAISSWAKRV